MKKSAKTSKVSAKKIASKVSLTEPTSLIPGLLFIIAISFFATVFALTQQKKTQTTSSSAAGALITPTPFVQAIPSNPTTGLKYSCQTGGWRTIYWTQVTGPNAPSYYEITWGDQLTISNKKYSDTVSARTSCVNGVCSYSNILIDPTATVVWQVRSAGNPRYVNGPQFVCAQANPKTKRLPPPKY